MAGSSWDGHDWTALLGLLATWVALVIGAIKYLLGHAKKHQETDTKLEQHDSYHREVKKRLDKNDEDHDTIMEKSHEIDLKVTESGRDIKHLLRSLERLNGKQG